MGKKAENIMIPENEVCIRVATQEDVEQIVRVHELSFPDYFLTNMGWGVLRRYYTTYVTHPDAAAAVITVSGEVCAFIVGTYRAASMIKAFYRSNFVFVFMAVLWKIVTLNPVILRGLSTRLCHLGIAVKAYFSLAGDAACQSPATQPGKEKKSGRAVAAATLPDYRGKDISSRLFSYFEQLLKEHGSDEVILSVNADNARAIRFYEKNGWKLLKDKGSELSFVKSL